MATIARYNGSVARIFLFVVGFAILFAILVPSRPHGASPSTDAPKVQVVTPGTNRDERSADANPQISYGEVRLNRGPGGQFHVDTRVNGQAIPFLVDTGADLVALTVSDARRLGLNINPYEFIPVGTGAGGALKGQPVILNQVEVGGRTLTNVEAVVIDGLQTNLLGQSVLRQFGRMELSGDTMVIHT
nr:TIGR02281 family clan AA aspartic protease [uncultured Sphingomonas sp.]